MNSDRAKWLILNRLVYNLKQGKKVTQRPCYAAVCLSDLGLCDFQSLPQSISFLSSTKANI